MRSISGSLVEAARTNLLNGSRYMPRRVNRKGRNKGRFIQLSHGMLDSQAFHALSPNAVTLLVKMLRLYNGYNNGDIGMGCRTAAEALGISKTTASRVFDELVEHGFLKITKDSAFNVKQRFTRRWALTCWPLREGEPPTNDWRTWKPVNPEDGSRTSTDSPVSGTDERIVEGD